MRANGAAATVIADPRAEEWTERRRAQRGTPVSGGPSRKQLIADLRMAAATKDRDPSPATLARLGRITGELINYHGRRSFEEFVRFNLVGFRQLPVCESALLSHLSGRDILVTGGTGCIGTAVLAELSKHEPRRLVSVARGVTQASTRVSGVEYLEADLRDPAALDRIFREVRPSIVYHVAAQRDPGAAEEAVHRTLTTNVFATQNVVDAARKHHVGLLVYASTGKAMRPFTRDTYAASKKLGEWLVGKAASRSGLVCAAARFTHVVDNSIVRRRLGEWIGDGTPIRLHAPDIAFYVQSARESAQLLLGAGLDAVPGRFQVHVIRDLGAPIDLVDLALGANVAMGRLSPVYFCGYEPGYEDHAYPGVFDPEISGEFSPLLNAFEAAMASRSPTSSGVDRFRFRAADSPRLRMRLRALSKACGRSAEPRAMRTTLDALSWDLFDAGLASSPLDVRRRTVARMTRTRERMSPEHARITEAVRASMGASLAAGA